MEFESMGKNLMPPPNPACPGKNAIWANPGKAEGVTRTQSYSSSEELGF